MPTTRPLDDDEQHELRDLSAQGAEVLDLPEEADLATRLEALRVLVERVRDGEPPAAPYDETDELAYALGSLWGDLVVAASGWTWTWLSLDDGLEGYALVPADRAYAVWPHHYLYGLLEVEEAENTVVVLAECIIEGELPPSEAEALLLLG